MASPQTSLYRGIIQAVSRPITITAGIQPTRKPAVGPAREVSVVRPPARTGRARPITITASTENTPLRHPSSAPASITPSVCRVIGTPAEPMLIWPGRPRTTMRAANTATCARSRVALRAWPVSIGMLMGLLAAVVVTHRPEHRSLWQQAVACCTFGVATGSRILARVAPAPV